MTATAYKIEDNIPLPPHANATPEAVALRELARANIGSSVLLAGTRGRITSSANYVGGTGWTATRSVEGGIRVWKIAEPARTIR